MPEQPSHPDKRSLPSESDTTTEGRPKRKKEINLVSLPHDDDAMDEEMAELFEEDEVSHQHGDSHPEAD